MFNDNDKCLQLFNLKNSPASLGLDSSQLSVLQSVSIACLNEGANGNYHYIRDTGSIPGEWLRGPAKPFIPLIADTQWHLGKLGGTKDDLHHESI